MGRVLLDLLVVTVPLDLRGSGVLTPEPSSRAQIFGSSSTVLVIVSLSHLYTFYVIPSALRCINYESGPVANETQARAEAQSYAVIVVQKSGSPEFPVSRPT